MAQTQAGTVIGGVMLARSPQIPRFIIEWMFGVSASNSRNRSWGVAQSSPMMATLGVSTMGKAPVQEKGALAGSGGLILSTPQSGDLRRWRRGPSEARVAPAGARVVGVWRCDRRGAAFHPRLDLRSDPFPRLRVCARRGDLLVQPGPADGARGSPAHGDLVVRVGVRHGERGFGDRRGADRPLRAPRGSLAGSLVAVRGREHDVHGRTPCRTGENRDRTPAVLRSGGRKTRGPVTRPPRGMLDARCGQCM